MVVEEPQNQLELWNANINSTHAHGFLAQQLEPHGIQSQATDSSWSSTLRYDQIFKKEAELQEEAWCAPH